MKKVINKLFILSSISLLLLSCGSGQTEDVVEVEPAKYSLDGDIQNLKAEYVYLSVRDQGEYNDLDSVSGEKGSFAFEGLVDFPELMYLRFKDSDLKIPIFMENSEITVSGDFDALEDVEISGSSIHDTYASIMDGVDEFSVQLDEIVSAYYEAEAESPEQDSLGDAYEAVDSDRMDYLKSEMDNNASNTVGPYILLSYLIYTVDLDTLKIYTNAFSSDIAESKYILDLNGIIERKESVEIGEIAPEFSSESPEGEIVRLTDFRGNYVLVDFWASWCGPCRAENPNVVKAYAKYHPMGLNILGISLDNDKDSWLEAIEADKLDWSHVSDLKGWKNEIAEMYEVKSIPHSILLDADGRIVAKNLRGEDLEAELERIYKE